jgi:hypothetical protein
MASRPKVRRARRTFGHAGAATAQGIEFVERVGVAERVRVVARPVERHDHAPVPGGPGVDLATAAGDEPPQALAQSGAQQAARRLWPERDDTVAVGLRRRRHGQLGIVRDERARQPLGEIGWEQGRVARHREQKGRPAPIETGQEPGQRPRVVGQIVGPHRRAERFVDRSVPVGVERDATDLQPQATQRVERQRQAVEHLQPLVGAAHARAETTGEHEARDVLRGDRAHPPM